MATSAHESVIREIFDATERKDWDTVTSHYHDDAIVEWPQSGERIRGREACLNVYRNYPEGSPSAELVRVVGDGDVAVAEGAIRYPDGSMWSAVQVYEFRDGKVAHEVGYFGQSFDAPEWRADWVERM